MRGPAVLLVAVATLLTSCVGNSPEEEFPPPQPPAPRGAVCRAGAPRSPLCPTGTTCPIVSEFEVQCGSQSGSFNVTVPPTATPDARTFISFNFTRQGGYQRHLDLAAVAPNGQATLEIDPLPFEYSDARVLADATGAARIVAASDSRVASFVRTQDGWSLEQEWPGRQLQDVAMGSDARLHVLHKTGNRVLTLTTRGASGAWSSQNLIEDSSFGTLETAGAEAYLAYFGHGSGGFDDQLFAHKLGATAQEITGHKPGILALVPPADTASPLLLASRDYSGPWTSPLAVLAQGPDAPATVTRVGGRVQSNCPFSCSSGCTGTCHEVVDQIANETFGLARTADGTVWLAYVTEHFERDLSVSKDDGIFFCSCEHTERQRTTPVYELVLANVGADATLQTRYRLPVKAELVGTYGGSKLRLSSRGQELHLSLMTYSSLRQIVIDTGRLP